MPPAAVMARRKGRQGRQSGSQVVRQAGRQSGSQAGRQAGITISGDGLPPVRNERKTVRQDTRSLSDKSTRDV